jgi:3',5'-cyclic AMP phosphodiesterase CpdA
MKIIHVSDLHLVAPGERLWGFDPLARLEACLADIAIHHADAAFCAISGDLAERGEIAAYEALKKRLERFPLKTFLMLGNHDDRANFTQVFGDRPRDRNGFIQHVEEMADFAVLCLDTLKGPPSSAGLYCAARRAWLTAQLSKLNGRPAVIFMHHPPFDIAHAMMDRIKLEDGEGFRALLKGRDVRHIFFGHAHRAISGQWHGIPFSATPSLVHQLPLVAGSVATVYSDEPPMYAVVHIEPEKTIVHFDAFLHRAPADMAPEAEREDWF